MITGRLNESSLKGIALTAGRIIAAQPVCPQDFFRGKQRINLQFTSTRKITLGAENCLSESTLGQWLVRHGQRLGLGQNDHQLFATVDKRSRQSMNELNRIHDMTTW